MLCGRRYVSLTFINLMLLFAHNNGNFTDVDVTDEGVDLVESKNDSSENSFQGTSSDVDVIFNRTCDNVSDYNYPDDIAQYHNYIDDENSMFLNEVLNRDEPGFDLTEEEIKKFKVWPGGAIPYLIDELSYDKVFRDRIRAFLEQVESQTPLQFLELQSGVNITSEARWVLFVNRRGALECEDYNHKSFTNTGVQRVTIGYDCLEKGGQMAALILALAGVPPQHVAPDRDKYVQVEIENVLPDKKHFFDTMKNTDWLFHDKHYDYMSASHYPFNKYTISGKSTITPKSIVQYEFGETNGFSTTDLSKIEMLYNYMVYKHRKSTILPDCSKLYRPGNKFNSYKPFSPPVRTPRPKPNKYLGIDENEPHHNSKQSDDEKERKHHNDQSISEVITSNEVSLITHEKKSNENSYTDDDDQQTNEVSQSQTV